MDNLEKITSPPSEHIKNNYSLLALFLVICWTWNFSHYGFD